MITELTPATLQIDQPLIDEYAQLTQDFNPLHLDAAFAAQTPMGGIIAHGTLSMNLVWQALEASFGAAAQGATLDIRFVRPVRVGDTVSARGTADAASAGLYAVWVENQRGEKVIEGTVQLAGTGA